MSAELSVMFREAAEAVEETELEKLRAAYPTWRIWRSRRGTRPAGWVATNRDPSSDRAPTLVADTAAGLERQLAAPAERVGAPFTTVAVSA